MLRPNGGDHAGTWEGERQSTFSYYAITTLLLRCFINQNILNINENAFDLGPMVEVTASLWFVQETNLQ